VHSRSSLKGRGTARSVVEGWSPRDDTYEIELFAEVPLHRYAVPLPFREDWVSEGLIQRNPNPKGTWRCAFDDAETTDGCFHARVGDILGAREEAQSF
jgi:hypothetical protein